MIAGRSGFPHTAPMAMPRFGVLLPQMADPKDMRPVTREVIAASR